MARRGRKPKTKEQKAKDAFERTAPAEHILRRRATFSFVEAPKGGEIDSEVCDAIGQLCALGLFDGHGHDPVDMRDKGRFWGGHYAILMKRSAASGANPFGWARETGEGGPVTAADLLFDKMDANLPYYERTILLSLVVDPLIGCGGHEAPYWAQALIDDELFKRGRFKEGMLVGHVTTDIEEKLAAAIRGLVVLVDGALPNRWAA